ncbi:MAG TPA: hypothetical protein VF461_20925, partial [Gemmatimonadaceae bacterium]
MPLGLSRRSGKDPIEHGSRALLGLRRRDHDLATLRRGRRIRVNECWRATRTSRASDATSACAAHTADRAHSR